MDDFTIEKLGVGLLALMGVVILIGIAATYDREVERIKACKVMCGDRTPAYVKGDCTCSK